MIAATIDIADGEYITVTRAGGYFPGLMKAGGSVKRCIRQGSRDGKSLPPGAFPFLVWLCPPGEDVRQYKVYAFHLTRRIRSAYRFTPKVGYVVALNLHAVRKWARDKFKNLTKQYSGLAKDAATVAMQKVSAKANGGGMRSGPKARRVLARTGMIEVKAPGGIFSGNLLVKDNIAYALKALRGGQRALNFALAKAANSVNGAINDYIRKNVDAFLDDHRKFDLEEVPFPEVVGV